MIGELLVRVSLHPGLLVLAFDVGCDTFLRHQVVGELDSQVGEIGFGGLASVFRVERVVLKLRIAQFQDYRVGFHGGV